jgi:uncharacterized membrane protein YoaT (DUF817 family)
MADRGMDILDHRLAPWAEARLPHALAAPLIFVAKFAWAALFGLLFLAAMVLTRAFWPEDWGMTRYDALLAFAVATQALFLWFRLETWEEAKVIAIFHVTGTAMEVYKLAQGSWDYPGQSLFEIGGVPLFSGFMYASVGSFIARAVRLFHMQIAPYPVFGLTVALAVLIYLNFFTHHFLPDIRMALFAATLILFWRTRIWFHVTDRAHWVPLPLAFLLAALLIYGAENVGTFTRTWVYAGQGAFDPVSPAKIGSWYLLLFVSFVSTTLILRDALHRAPIRPAPREIYRNRAVIGAVSR